MVVIIFLIGISIGSFLNCFVYRIEIGEKPKGRSYCPKCKHQLSYKDLVPIFSYLFLRGKCRYCKEKISLEYPLVELLTGALFSFAFLFLSNNGIFESSLILGVVEMFFLSVVLFFLIFIFVYDFKHFIIPDFATFSLVGVSSVFLILQSFLEKDFNFIFSGVLSAIGAFLFFFALYFFTKGKGMGFGDVKFVVFMGLFLRFPNIIVALFISFLFGAIMGLGLIILGKKKMKSQIPFGPFLITGTLLAYFYGAKIIEIYLSYL